MTGRRDVSVVAVVLLEDALVPDRFFEEIGNSLVDGIEEKIGIQGNFKRLSRIAKSGMSWQQRTGPENDDASRPDESRHRVE